MDPELGSERHSVSIQLTNSLDDDLNISTDVNCKPPPMVETVAVVSTVVTNTNDHVTNLMLSPSSLSSPQSPSSSSIIVVSSSSIKKSATKTISDSSSTISTISTVSSSTSSSPPPTPTTLPLHSSLHRGSSPRLSLESSGSTKSGSVASSTSCPSSNRTSFLAEAVAYSDGQSNASGNICSLVWKNLTYTIESSKWSFSAPCGFKRSTSKKVIFSGLSGEVKSGQLTAVIGQSGVGKSTLLESIAGRRKQGLKGEAYLKFAGSTSGRIGNSAQVSFIPQKDAHLPCLTVKETLMYASRLKNSKSARRAVSRCKKLASFDFLTEMDYHNYLITQVQKDLCLGRCWDVKVSRCSGGEIKRLSMAVELISNPKVIILDEPTTGLDSTSAFHCIEVLNCLTEMESPPGIIASIHQPSSELLNLFHNVYVIGAGGRCIYFGPTDQLVSHLASNGLHCPLYHNPAEFIVHVASGRYGEKVLNNLATAQTDSFENLHIAIKSEEIDMDVDKIDVKRLYQENNRKQHPTCNHIGLLLTRTWKSTIRQPMLTWLRLSQYLLVGLILSFLHNYKIGELDGCYTDVLRNASAFSGEHNYGQLLARINDNTATIYFALMFLIGVAIVPTVLTFPSEIAVIFNERHNGWYSSFSYYIAKIMAETPLSAALPFLFSALFYYITGQIPEYGRFMLFYLIIFLLSIIGQTIGLIMGTIFMDDPPSAVFMSISTLCPIFIVGGFLLRESILVWFLKPLWYLSYVRYGFSSIIVALYGFGRCGTEYKTPLRRSVIPQLTQLIQDEDIGCVYDQYQLNSDCFDDVLRECNTTMDYIYKATIGREENRFSASLDQYDGSFVMSYYEVTNTQFHVNIVVLILYALALIIINYWILIFKIKRKIKK
ncbi:ATP-binding cassette sub-family G member 4-like [Panonychus citri]|uniref:ATP-binding cassette sub-family G member 4-like n=1 Tax=Panonychus citri TaxID=50023 RepID=UPI002306DFCA|nr:ATP-binding cassette sub-family G member 4-like [Panonychus citri]